MRTHFSFRNATTFLTMVVSMALFAAWQIECANAAGVRLGRGS